MGDYGGNTEHGKSLCAGIPRHGVLLHHCAAWWVVAVKVDRTHAERAEKAKSVDRCMAGGAFVLRYAVVAGPISSMEELPWHKLVVIVVVPNGAGEWASEVGGER